MAPSVISDSLLWQALWAIGVVAISGAVARLVLLLARRLRGLLERRRPLAPAAHLVASVTPAVVALVAVEGFFAGVSALPALGSWRPALNRAHLALVIALLTFGTSQGVGSLFRWYSSTLRARTTPPMDETVLSVLRRLAVLTVYTAGALILLDQMGVAITPLLAGLGVGGLAVALALQPTLGNFFAGAQIVSDRVARPGDFIVLDNGVEGYVIEVGWRSTRIRTMYNNLVIIPNSRLAESIITNYHSPSRDIAVMVEAGVSYEADLARVERLVLQVAREVIQDLPEAVKTVEPWFGYSRFGESNIEFWVWLYAADRVASFRLKTELIKRLHARFRQEGITINYPVRQLLLPPTLDTPPKG